MPGGSYSPRWRGITIPCKENRESLLTGFGNKLYGDDNSLDLRLGCVTLRGNQTIGIGKEWNVHQKTRELNIKELGEAAGRRANEYRYRVNRKGYH